MWTQQQAGANLQYKKGSNKREKIKNTVRNINNNKNSIILILCIGFFRMRPASKKGKKGKKRQKKGKKGKKMKKNRKKGKKMEKKGKKGKKREKKGNKG